MKVDLLALLDRFKILLSIITAIPLVITAWNYFAKSHDVYRIECRLYYLSLNNDRKIQLLASSLEKFQIIEEMSHLEKIKDSAMDLIRYKKLESRLLAIEKSIYDHNFYIGSLEERLSSKCEH